MNPNGVLYHELTKDANRYIVMMETPHYTKFRQLSFSKLKNKNTVIVGMYNYITNSYSHNQKDSIIPNEGLKSTSNFLINQ